MGDYLEIEFFSSVLRNRLNSLNESYKTSIAAYCLGSNTMTVEILFEIK